MHTHVHTQQEHTGNHLHTHTKNTHMHKYTKKMDVLAEWWAQIHFLRRPVHTHVHIHTCTHTRAHTAPPAPAELLSQ